MALTPSHARGTVMVVGVDIHLVARMDVVVAPVIRLVVVVMDVVFVGICVPMGVGMGVGMSVIMDKIAVPMFVGVYVTMGVSMLMSNRFFHILFPFEPVNGFTVEPFHFLDPRLRLSHEVHRSTSADLL